MNNKLEVIRWMKDARSYFDQAEAAFSGGNWHGATQNAQLCIETSCKAVISYFCEPEWTHSLGEQLRIVLEKSREEIEKRVNFEGLIQLSEDADFAGPWHGLSTYGEVREGIHYAAVDICTKDVALDLLNRARRSYKSAEEFLEVIKVVNERREFRG